MTLVTQRKQGLRRGVARCSASTGWRVRTGRGAGEHWCATEPDSCKVLQRVNFIAFGFHNSAKLKYCCTRLQLQHAQVSRSNATGLGHRYTSTPQTVQLPLRQRFYISSFLFPVSRSKNYQLLIISCSLFIEAVIIDCCASNFKFPATFTANARLSRQSCPDNVLEVMGLKRSVLDISTRLAQSDMRHI